MNPQNIDCLKAANIYVYALANNHVLDWGYPGLRNTLKNLEKVRVSGVGAGTRLEQVVSPAVGKLRGKGGVPLF